MPTRVPALATIGPSSLADCLAGWAYAAEAVGELFDARDAAQRLPFEVKEALGTVRALRKRAEAFSTNASPSEAREFVAEWDAADPAGTLRRFDLCLGRWQSLLNRLCMGVRDKANTEKALEDFLKRVGGQTAERAVPYPLVLAARSYARATQENPRAEAFLVGAIEQLQAPSVRTWRP